MSFTKQACKALSMQTFRDRVVRERERERQQERGLGRPAMAFKKQACKALFM